MDQLDGPALHRSACLAARRCDRRWGPGALCSICLCIHPHLKPSHDVRACAAVASCSPHSPPWPNTGVTAAEHRQHRCEALVGLIECGCTDRSAAVLKADSSSPSARQLSLALRPRRQLTHARRKPRALPVMFRDLKAGRGRRAHPPCAASPSRMVRGPWMREQRMRLPAHRSGQGGGS